MSLRTWAAMAAAALLVAGCGSSIGGQALPAVPTSSAAVTSTSATGISVAPFPEPSAAEPSTAEPGTAEPGTAASSGAVPTSEATSTPTTSTAPTKASTAPVPATTAPSTTVTWLLPLPKGGTDKVNKYGNVVAAPGQSFAIQWRSNKQIAVVFVIDSIQVDRGCATTVKPKNGHLVVITVRTQLGYSTGADLSDESIGFTDDFWTAFDAKDTAQVDVDTSATEACVPYDKQQIYANDMEPDKVYTGKIALDVSTATGTAVLMNSLDGGWIYHYG